MSKEETALKEATENVQNLVKECNNMIESFGIDIKCLYEAIVEIQQRFDQIRNIPNDKLIEYNNVCSVTLSWKEHVDKIEEEYNNAINTDIKSGAATAAFGAGVATLGPAAAMGVATTFGVASTGTAISALSGAAATNAALAWLGGGALAAGGGGMVAGNALLALAGPVGLAIAAFGIIGGGFLFFKERAEKKRLEEIYLLISERDKKKYEKAIVELKERKTRAQNETIILKNALITVGSFGLDYNQMTKEQQYILGSYVNLMNASNQLLVNPILGLQPNFDENDLNLFRRGCIFPQYIMRQAHGIELIVYMSNLLYKIDLDDYDRNVLSKSFRKNKKFIERMDKEKKIINEEFFKLIDRILQFTYNRKSRQ